MGRALKKGILVVIAALSCVAVMWLFSKVLVFAAGYALERATASQKAPCAEALAFGGAKLPPGAYDARCTTETWLDITYDGDFRMRRDGVRDWLRSAFPHAPKPDTEYCGKGVDLCLDLNGGGDHGPPSGAKADAVEVDVTYEGHGRALVRFTAYTV